MTTTTRQLGTGKLASNNVNVLNNKIMRVLSVLAASSAFLLLSGMSSTKPMMQKTDTPSVGPFGRDFQKANFTHYISNNTLIDFRLAHSQHREWESSHELPHFYVHIPKTAGTTAYRWFLSTLRKSPQMSQLRVIGNIHSAVKYCTRTPGVPCVLPSNTTNQKQQTRTHSSAIQDNSSSVNTIIVQNPPIIPIKKPKEENI